jgi:hypothetical protein
MVIEFTTLIKKFLLVFDDITRGVVLDESTYLVDGGALANVSFAMETTGEMVATEDAICPTIETSVIHNGMAFFF